MSATEEDAGRNTHCTCNNCTERTKAESSKILAESRKLEAEAEEIRERAGRSWVELLAKPLLTATLAAVVAGAATWKFGLDAAINLNELNRKEREAINEESKAAHAKAEAAEKKSLQVDQEARQAREASERASADRDILVLQLKQLRERAPTPQVKEFADTAATRLSEEQQVAPRATPGTEPWYAVVASSYSNDDVKRIVSDLKSRQQTYPVEVFKATDAKGTPVFAVTLGGQVAKTDALRIVGEAKSQGISPDAFAWNSPRWRKVDPDSAR